MENSRLWVTLVALGILLTQIRCSKSNSSSGGAALSAFPKSLALASPTQNGTSRDFLYRSGQLQAGAASTYSAKKSAINTLLTGTKISDCAFTSNLGALPPAVPLCYGPSMTYTNHPQNATSAPGGDLGIVLASDSLSGNACAAATLNAKVNSLTSEVDTATYLMASVMCIAKVDGVSLPSAGASVDLTSQVQTAFTTNNTGLTVSSVSLAAGNNTSDGFPTYITTVVVTTGTKTMTTRIKHIPTASDNSTYRGKISFTLADTTSPSMGNCVGGSASGQTDATSISYAQSSATSLSLQLQSGHFCGSSANPYVSSTNFTVDLTKNYNAQSRPTGWADNGNLALFNLNPSDGTGNFEFAWQAGGGDDATRVFNLSLTSASGTESGCAYFGFGTPMPSGGTPAAITKFICNWASVQPPAAPDHTGIAKAQRQCITSSAGGAFTATSNNITYAPINPVSGACTSDGTFAMTPQGGTKIQGPITDNLYSLSSIADFTAPTAPTDVDQ